MFVGTFVFLGPTPKPKQKYIFFGGPLLGPFGYNQVSVAILARTAFAPALDSLKESTLHLVLRPFARQRAELREDFDGILGS